MANETVLKNAQIVLADEIVSGSILIRDGKIAAIDQGNTNGGDDMDGDYVIPGLIELHTDQLESHYAPRPKVHRLQHRASRQFSMRCALVLIMTVTSWARICGCLLTPSKAVFGKIACVQTTFCTCAAKYPQQIALKHSSFSQVMTALNSLR
jgi:hypothetical protein